MKNIKFGVLKSAALLTLGVLSHASSLQAYNDFSYLDRAVYVPEIDTCSMKFYVDENDLYSMDVINERLVPLNQSPVCTYQSKCNGTAIVYHCKNSKCTSDSGATLTVLSNGKILTLSPQGQSITSDRSPSSNFKICP